MIEDKMIESLAKGKGISISNKMVDDNVDRKLDEYGNEEEISNSLDKLYDWSLDDFKNKIVKPSLYKDELENWLEENDGKDKKSSSEKKAIEALEKLKNGTEFDSLAKQISEGGTSDSGGRLGWFKENQISTEIKNEVITLENGEISDILESGLGYHIVKLNETKEIEGEKGYNISQIFFPKMSFANWLNDQIKKTDIFVLLRDYDFNKETGMVEFKDEFMKEFEQKYLNSAQIDASLLNP